MPDLPRVCVHAQFSSGWLVQIEPENCSLENSSSDSAGRPRGAKIFASYLPRAQRLAASIARRDAPLATDCIRKSSIEQSNKATPIFNKPG